MTDAGLWIAAALALGGLAGWLLAHRGFRRGLRELERYLEHWLEAEAAEVVAVAAAVAAPRRPRRLKPVFDRLDDHRRVFLDLRSSSDATTRRLEKLIDVLSEAVLLYGPRGELLFASREIRALARAAGWAEAEGEDEPARLHAVTEFLRERSEVPEVVAAAFADTRDRQDREVSFRTQDGERRFLATAHVVPARSDGVLGLLLLLTDVAVLEEMRQSGLRRVALEHVRLAAQLLSHRVRNPLNSITLLVELLRRERVRAGAPPEKNLDTIQTETNKLERTLARFIQQVRERDEKRDVLDLVDIVQEVAELLYLPARDAGVGVRQELRVSAAPVRGDAGEITRSVLAALVPALRASRSGDELSFTLDSEAREHLLLVETRVAPTPLDLGVAEELAGRNGGSVSVDDAAQPQRLLYRYRAERKDGLDPARK